MSKKEKKNYVDYIPVINKKWELKENEIVEIVVENKGIFNKIAQKFFRKPKYSFIKLDEYGSFVWRQIDGKKSIYEIGQLLEKQYEGTRNQLYERLSKFIGILESNGYVSFVNKE